MRMRKKPNLIPRMELCADVRILEPETKKGRWRELMPHCTELRLELGCGKGKFTVETASLHPDTLFIAVERVPEAMVMAMEKAVAMELTNVFFIDADAEMLPEYFDAGEIDLIYINFCDPWPSKRRAKRRLTSPGFLEKYKLVMKSGSEIHFKTDNQPLFEYSLEQFSENGFSLSEVTRDLHANGQVGVMTGYEEKFYNLGTKICRAVARKEVDA